MNQRENKKGKRTQTEIRNKEILEIQCKAVAKELAKQISYLRHSIQKEKAQKYLKK